MNFDHSYMTKEKMKKGGEGVFSSQFKSYISDGKMQDQIYGENMTREKVLEDVRKNLRQQMQEANTESLQNAVRMQAEHKQLRQQMQEALIRTKEATRRKNRLKADLLAEKSRQSKEKAREAETELDQMTESHERAQEADEGLKDAVRTGKYERRNMALADMSQDELLTTARNEEELSEEDMKARSEDIEYFADKRFEAFGNQQAEHHKNLSSLFHAISKYNKRREIEKDIEAQDALIEAEKQSVREKSRAFNEKRKRDYESGSFRKHYEAYDAAIARYRMLTRKGDDNAALVPKKDVREYVGEFDLEKLDHTLERLKDNPYIKVDVAIKNKKDGRGITDDELLKSHKKIVMVSEKMGAEGVQGQRLRYKVDNDFNEGYIAARQFKADDPTALTERSAAFVKKSEKIDKLRLKIDKKDATGEYLTSEDNVEIIQAKTGKWYQKKKILNGVFINGEFVSTDLNVIRGKADASTIGLTNTWKKVALGEKVRKAALKMGLFHLINARTIQHAAGYGASNQVGANKIRNKLLQEIKESHALTKEEEKNTSSEELVADFFESVERNDRYDKMFDKETEEKLLKQDNALPDETEADWEQVITKGDEQKIAEIPMAGKVKVAYDVIRQELHRDAGQKKMIQNTDTRIGKVIDAVRKDRRAMMDLALLLLSHDENPEYWDIAKVICVDMMDGEYKTEGFTDFTKEQKDANNFVRALEYGRANSGQLMRVALIDELKSERKRIDIENLFGSLLPTSWKQYKEDIAGQRGYGAILKQKLVDGTVTKFIGNLFDGFITTTDFFGAFGDATQANLEFTNKYMGLLTSAMDFGAISETGAYVITDLLDETTVEVDEKSGEEIEKHSATANQKYISNAFKGVKNLCKIIKMINKCKKEREKAIEEKASTEPDYDPQEDLKLLDQRWYDLSLSISQTVLSVGADIAKLCGKKGKSVAGIGGLIKSVLTTVESGLEAHSARLQKNRIIAGEEELETLMSKKEEDKTADEKEMTEVLKKNSQLQYGVSLARRQAKDKFVSKTIETTGNAGGAVFSILNTAHIDKLFPPLELVEAGWWLLNSIVETGTEMIQHGQNVKFNIGKAFGEKFKNANKSVLNKVLKRYAGISSVDYLPDLARIFMSINTHVFIKEAKTDAEKNLAVKISRLLLNNRNITKDSLKQVKVKDLMNVMGVEGNFHKILKYSLA